MQTGQIQTATVKRKLYLIYFNSVFFLILVLNYHIFKRFMPLKTKKKYDKVIQTKIMLCDNIF